MTMNAAQTLLQAGAAQATALECGSETVTYDALRERVRRAAGAWRGLGLRPGERVIVTAPDSIDWVVAYLGVIWAGGVVIGVNPRLALTELAPILLESEVRFVWCEADSVNSLAPLLAGMAQAPTLVVSSTGDSNWARELDLAPEVDPVQQDEQAPALWIGTSGTTGVSKGVIHAQRMALQPHSFACGVLQLTAADRLYASSKLFFAYALGNSLLAGLRAGAAVILDRHWPDPERVLAMVRAHRPTLVFCVPTLYSKVLQDGMAHQLAGQGIRHFVSAGESLPASVRQGWRAATGGGDRERLRHLRDAVPDALQRGRRRPAANHDADAAALCARCRPRAPAAHLASQRRGRARLLEAAAGASRRFSGRLVLPRRHVLAPRR